MNDITVFGMKIKREAKLDASAFPPVLVSSMSLYKGSAGATPCIVVDASSTVRPAQISKLFASIEKREQLPALLVCETLSAVKQRDLTERGIAWIQSSETFSVPFLAASSRKASRAQMQPKLSNGAAHVAVGIIMGNWPGKTTSEIAALMGKSVTSAMNYFKELDAVCPGIIGSKGRSRFINAAERPSEELFDLFVEHMPQTVLKRTWYRLDPAKKTSDGDLPLSGLSALSTHTSIADDSWLTYAAGPSCKNALARIESECLRVGRDESPDILVESWSRDPMTSNGAVYGADLLICCMELQRIEDDERLEGALEAYRKELFA